MTAERKKYLYRVRATYAEGYTRTWHYQSKRAAERRRFLAEHGYSQGWSDGEPGSTTTIPPAQSVTLEVSEPVTWPAGAR